MTTFKNMGTQGLEESTDRLGGYQPLESGIYQATIKAFYAGKSQGGAHNLTLIADVGGGREYKETIYFTNKQGENFFVQKESGKKSPLPGFTVVDDICLMATGEPLEKQETEEKVINVYNWEARKEEPTRVDMITAAIGQTVALGILRKTENKSEKDASGKYVPTAETRDVNAIDKVFHPELHVTVAEARKGATTIADAKFWDQWEAKNAGVTKDDRKIKDGATGGSVGGGKPPAASGGQAAPKTSLFGAKK